VISDLGEILVQNRMHLVAFGDRTGRTGLDRYTVWRWFTKPPERERFPDADWDRLARKHVADLRATAARRAGDPDVTELVSRLRATSPEFEKLWSAHEVAVRLSDAKRVLDPRVGPLDLVCETLVTPSAAQRLLVYYPRVGSDTQEKLDLLRVIGTQTLAAETRTQDEAVDRG
jgi:hypothetical protein